MCLLRPFDHKEPCDHEDCKLASNITNPLCRHTDGSDSARYSTSQEQSPTPITPAKFKKVKLTGEVNLVDALESRKSAFRPTAQAKKPESGIPETSIQSAFYGQNILSYLKSQGEMGMRGSFKRVEEPQQMIQPQQPQQPQQAQQNPMNMNAIYQLIAKQSHALVELKEKNEKMQESVGTLFNEVNALRNVIYKSIAIQSAPGGYCQGSGSSQDIATQEHLLSVLYPQPHQFGFQLVARGNFESKLYRERNFHLEVEMVDIHTHTRVDNLNRFPIVLSLYTSEVPPKKINVNTSGNKVLKGTVEGELVNGVVIFDKVQVNEVTSHFRNGWVFLVAHPRLDTPMTTLRMISQYCGGLFIEPLRVRPLIFEKVVVKAKKAKEVSQPGASDI